MYRKRKTKRIFNLRTVLNSRYRNINYRNAVCGLLQVQSAQGEREERRGGSYTVHSRSLLVEEHEEGKSILLILFLCDSLSGREEVDATLQQNPHAVLDPRHHLSALLGLWTSEGS